MSEKPMTGEITAFRWYIVQGYPPRLQWMERTMPPQWHDVPLVFERGWPLPTGANIEQERTSKPAASPSTRAARGMQPMDEWRAIETAPKDGTRVLLGRFVRGDDYDNRIAVDYWHLPKDEDFTGWGRFNQRFWPPTHWMPLPARPEGK